MENKAELVFEKLAGVGWDIHAYDVSPEELKAKSSAAQKTYKQNNKRIQKAVGDYPKKDKYLTKPSLLGKIFGKKPTLKKEEYNTARKNYSDKLNKFFKDNPDIDLNSEWDVLKKHRVNSPHSKKSNYKYNMNVSSSTGTNFNKYVTDRAYKDGPRKNLSHDDIKKVITNFKGSSKKYNNSDNEVIKKYKKEHQESAQGFVDKAEDLLKNKKSKFFRLEME